MFSGLHGTPNIPLYSSTHSIYRPFPMRCCKEVPVDEKFVLGLQSVKSCSNIMILELWYWAIRPNWRQLHWGWYGLQDHVNLCHHSLLGMVQVIWHYNLGVQRVRMPEGNGEHADLVLLPVGTLDLIYVHISICTLIDGLPLMFVGQCLLALYEAMFHELW